MITIKDVRDKTMTQAKRDEAKNSLFAFYVGRPLSYLLTIPFLYTRISPNVITLISLLFSISGFCFITFGQSLLFHIIGFAMFFMWNLFDGVDGNVARYKGLKSANGDLLDTLGGYLSMVLIILAMGNIGSFYEKSHIYLNQSLPCILSGLSAISTLIPRLLMHRKNSQQKSYDESADTLKNKTKYSVPKIIVLNLCDPAGFQQPLMLICIIFNLATEFTFFYFVVNFIVMVYSIFQLLERKR